MYSLIVALNYSLALTLAFVNFTKSFDRHDIIYFTAERKSNLIRIIPLLGPLSLSLSIEAVKLVLLL